MDYHPMEWVIFVAQLYDIGSEKDYIRTVVGQGTFRKNYRFYLYNLLHILRLFFLLHLIAPLIFLYLLLHSS